MSTNPSNSYSDKYWDQLLEDQNNAPEIDEDTLAAEEAADNKLYEDVINRRDCPHLG